MRVISTSIVHFGTLYVKNKPVSIPGAGFASPWDVKLYNGYDRFFIGDTRKGYEIPWREVVWATKIREYYCLSNLLKDISKDMIREWRAGDCRISVDYKSYRLKLPDAGLSQQEMYGSPWGSLMSYLKGDMENSMGWMDIYSLAAGEIQGMFTPLAGCYAGNQWSSDYNYYSSRMIGWRPVLEELKSEEDSEIWRGGDENR